MRKIMRPLSLAIVLFLGMLSGAQAALRTTFAAGYWTNAATWVDSALPQTGDDVTLAHAVTLDQPTPALNSFSNNAALTFVGWETVLTAATVTVNATITHPAQSDTNGTAGVYEDWIPDNRVWIVCSNLTVNAGKSITADGKGYLGAQGPGVPFSKYFGGSHGGVGGQARYPVAGMSGIAYGSVEAPQDPGSGGLISSTTAAGGKGGGVVRIEASGHVQVDGTVAANGEDFINGNMGTGAGGSIHVTCATFGGTGILTVRGGGGIAYGGGGGGGRIAVAYDAAAQAATNLLNRPTVTLAAGQGYQSHSYDSGGVRPRPGTIWLTDAGFFPGESIQGGGELHFGSVSELSFAQLSVGNAITVFPEGVPVHVTGGVTVSGNGVSPKGGDYSRHCGIEIAHAGDMDVGSDLVVGDGLFAITGRTGGATRLTVGGDFVLTNNAFMRAYSGPTNVVVADPNVLVQVTGKLLLNSGSWIYPHSDPVGGGHALFEADSIQVPTGSGFDADSIGFQGLPGNQERGYGPGAGSSTFGGSHGGLGGKGRYAGDTLGTYGCSNAPVTAGSAGGSYNNYTGLTGGGVIRIVCRRELLMDGTLTANSPATSIQSGGGAGGSVNLHCRTFRGTGTIRADGGGNGGSYGGGGGGGRIAMTSTHDFFTGGVSAAPGIKPAAYGTYPEQGTIVRILLPASGTVLLMR